MNETYVRLSYRIIIIIITARRAIEICIDRERGDVNVFFNLC